MLSWTFIQDNVGALLIGRYNVEPALHSINPSKIASFDLDSTLILTKSDSLHVIDHHDWKWWHPTVVPKLRAVSSQGYSVVIFTNQGRLTTATGSEAEEMTVFKTKVEAVAENLGVPFTLYAACANDGYRKPRTRMWSFMCADFGLRSQSPIEDSVASWVAGKEQEIDVFMVGDAAGRQSDPSDSDVHFCQNLGIKFFTPEEFFLGDKTQVVGHKFDPNWYLPVTLGGRAIPKPTVKLPLYSAETRLIVLVGLPGSGKTTCYRKFFEPIGFERIVLLDSGDPARSIQAAEKFLLEGKLIVIDGINSSAEARKCWVSLAENHGFQAEALNFTTPADLCLHNDAVRALGGPLMNIEQRGIFARIPFLKIQADLQKPEASEGFAEILDVDFEWVGNDDELVIWRRHWL